MKARSLSPRLFAVACIVIFAGNAALAKQADDAKTPPAAADAPAKAKGKKSEKPASADADAKPKPKPGRYATEAEAKAHCRGTVVWIDKDNFNHWPGSREYGRQPGSFGCENS